MRKNRFFNALIVFSIMLGTSIISVGTSNAQHIRELEVEFTHASRKKLPGIDAEAGEVNLFLNEPFFKKVEFKHIEEPYSLQERVDSILYGIYTDVPPEYDHYGYEVRRYMASTGNGNSLKDPEFIVAQLKNIKNAMIILEYWQIEVKEDIEMIDKTISERSNRTNTRTIFKYNRGVSTAFFVEAQNWMQNNKILLEFLQGIEPSAYRYNPETSVLTFKNKEHLREFAAIYKAKVLSLRQIRTYLPFRMMIY
jgi:hypothetical protein